jgi:hypothetical protein
MTSRGGNTAETAAKAILEVFATIRDRAKEIFWILNENAAVAGVTSGCDIGRSSDFMTGRPEHFFDIYVEATTRSDESFCWHVTVVLTTNGWELDRSISTPSGQRNVEVKFEEVAFERFDDLAASHSTLIDELVESARAFDFDNPYKSAPGNPSA